MCLLLCRLLSSIISALYLIFSLPSLHLCHPFPPKSTYVLYLKYSFSYRQKTRKGSPSLKNEQFLFIFFPSPAATWEQPQRSVVSPPKTHRCRNIQEWTNKDGEGQRLDINDTLQPFLFLTGWILKKSCNGSKWKGRGRAPQ